jgi:hypothetical protein
MSNYINQAVEDVDIDTITTNGATDIISYVKIKKIPFVDSSATQYIRGVVCRKNVSHKRM